MGEAPDGNLSGLKELSVTLQEARQAGLRIDEGKEPEALLGIANAALRGNGGTERFVLNPAGDRVTLIIRAAIFPAVRKKLDDVLAGKVQFNPLPTSVAVVSE